jgi:hypothetical protein
VQTVAQLRVHENRGTSCVSSVDSFSRRPILHRICPWMYSYVIEKKTLVTEITVYFTLVLCRDAKLDWKSDNIAQELNEIIRLS